MRNHLREIGSEIRHFPLQQEMALILQASASDNLVLERVEFYIDDRLVGTTVEAPYTISWQPKLGEHTLLVRAYDLAGNTSETTATFTVEQP